MYSSVKYREKDSLISMISTCNLLYRIYVQNLSYDNQHVENLV